MRTLNQHVPVMFLPRSILDVLDGCHAHTLLLGAQTHTHTQTHTDTPTRTHTHTHTHTHTNTHSHTHIHSKIHYITCFGNSTAQVSAVTCCDQRFLGTFI